MDLNKEEMIITDYTKIWSELLNITHKNEILKFIKEYPHKKSIFIDFKKLDKYGYAKKIHGEHLPDYILNHPDEAVKDIRDAIDSGYNEYDIENKQKYNFNNINIRIYNLPKSIPIRDIRSEHIGKLIQIEGTISKQTAVNPRIIRAQFRCLECGTLTQIYTQKYKEFIEPYRNCTQCERKTKMEIYDDGCTLIDCQKIRVQESYDVLEGSETPLSVDIDIKEDLCQQFQPGNLVCVTGVLRSYQKTKGGSKQTDYALYIDAHCIKKLESTFNEIQISDEEEEKIIKFSKEVNTLETLAQSLAYSIYGYDLIKRAAILQLVGGNRKKKKDGTTTRGDIHILLAADPSTSKSVVMKATIRLSPRGIFTTGKGSSAAGLTAAAVKDEFGDGSWTLEAGALVLGSGGHVAVDEIHTMNKNDYSAIYEAMEQQTVSIAKAGISATLQSQTSVIAACNPKLGRFDEYIPLWQQIELPSPLMSRFDLVFIMRDIPNKDKDYKIAMKMMEEEIEDWEDTDQYLSEDFIRKYIAYCRKIQPKLTKETSLKIAEYYSDKRQSSDVISMTARQNGGLIRLAQAHAKLRLSEKVEEIDAKVAIQVVEDCIKDVATIDGKTDIDNMIGCPNKNTRDMTRTIIEYIKLNKSIVNDINDVVNKKDLIDALTSQGFDRNKIEKRIDSLKSDGELLEPRFNLIKKL